MSSKLLINESPLQVLPTLGAWIGVNEAIILQQIHYSSSKHESSYMRFNFHEQAEDLKMWSVPTLKRIIKNLRDAKLVSVGNFNDDRSDRSLWLAPDFDIINNLNGPIKRQQSIQNNRAKAAKLARKKKAKSQDETMANLSAKSQDETMGAKSQDDTDQSIKMRRCSSYIREKEGESARVRAREKESPPDDLLKLLRQDQTKIDPFIDNDLAMPTGWVQQQFLTFTEVYTPKQLRDAWQWFLLSPAPGGEIYHRFKHYLRNLTQIMAAQLVNQKYRPDGKYSKNPDIVV